MLHEDLLVDTEELEATDADLEFCTNACELVRSKKFEKFLRIFNTYRNEVSRREHRWSMTTHLNPGLVEYDGDLARECWEFFLELQSRGRIRVSERIQQIAQQTLDRIMKGSKRVHKAQLSLGTAEMFASKLLEQDFDPKDS